MKIQEVMTREVVCCGPDTDLAAVAMMMWRYDCGIVPVLEEGTRRVVGVVTDRDICMAAATQHRPVSQIPAGSFAARPLHTIQAGDTVQSALDAMGERQVRRLPVVNGRGELEGLVSLNDLVLLAEPGRARRPGVPRAENVLLAHRRICAHRAPTAHGSRAPRRSPRVEREPAVSSS